MVTSFIEPKTETGLVAPLERALLASPPPAVKPDDLLVPDILSLYQTNSFLTVRDLESTISLMFQNKKRMVLT